MVDQLTGNKQAQVMLSLNLHQTRAVQKILAVPVLDKSINHFFRSVSISLF